MKQCIDCHKNESEIQFTKSKQIKKIRCDVCYRAYFNMQQAKYRNKNKEKIKEYAKTYRKTTAEHRKWYARLWKYGMTITEYYDLLDKQNGSCAICKKPSESNKLLVVDHDHSCCPGIRSCGKCIRGLLCTRCNQGIGFLQDNIDILTHARDYLEKREVVEN